jgi:hypothetical protein
MLTIIEDCDPFYVNFTHAGVAEIINLCQKELTKIPKVVTFLHHKLPTEVSKKILNLIPFSEKIKFQEDRVSLFISAPGYRHCIHIDGASVSLNYGISIVNDKCVTNWYSNTDINSNFKVTPDMPWNRAVIDISEFDKNKQVPIKSFTQKQQQVVLLNTLMYHDFDNSSSKDDRVILTLRPINKQMPWNEIKNNIQGLE